MTTTRRARPTPAAPPDFVSVDVPGYRGRVHVQVDGPQDAPAVLLAHGFTGSLVWWRWVARRLADTFRVVRYDLLGHGLTGGPAADAPLQTDVAAALLAQLDLRDVTVVGHSFGADVAAGLALTSDRAGRTVIVCQAPDYSDATFPRGTPLMTTPVVGRSLLGLGRGLATTVDAGLRVAGPRLSPERRRYAGFARQAADDLRRLHPGMFDVVLTRRRARLAAYPLDAQLRDSGLPALVILGGRDHFYGARSAERYRVAGARVEILPESHHSAQFEFPDELATLIRDFAQG